jgi:SAM-dependent methyltransferase
MDSMDLTAFPANTFTHTYMTTAIFMIPDPVRALAEIKRTLQPGGVALVTSFEDQGFVATFQDAQRAIRPDADVWKGTLPSEWLTEGRLRTVVEGGGFEAAKVQIHRFSTWVGVEEWDKPAMELLREPFTKMATEGWSEAERGRFEERLGRDIEDQKARGAKYEMKVFVAVAGK